jgi:hypothetical protein
MNKIVVIIISIFLCTNFIESAAQIPHQTRSAAAHYSSKASKKLFGQELTAKLAQHAHTGKYLWNLFWQQPTQNELKLLGFKHGVIEAHQEKYTPPYLKSIHDYWQHQIENYHFAHQLKCANNPQLQDAYARAYQAHLHARNLDTVTRNAIKLKQQHDKAYNRWLNSPNNAIKLYRQHQLLQSEKTLESHLSHIPRLQMPSYHY